MSQMIVKGASLQETHHRLDYGIKRLQDNLKHFVIWSTRPENPFGPHKHPGWEFLPTLLAIPIVGRQSWQNWYILEGEGVVSLDGETYPVEPGDLVYLPPESEHGLRTTTSVRWICLG